MRTIISLALISCIFTTVVFLNDAPNATKSCPKFTCSSSANSAADGGCQEFTGTTDDGNREVKEYTCADKDNKKQFCPYDLVNFETSTAKAACVEAVVPPTPEKKPTQWAGEKCSVLKETPLQTDCNSYNYMVKGTDGKWSPTASLGVACATDKCVGNAAGEACESDSSCNVGLWCDLSKTLADTPVNSGTCTANIAAGQACTASNQCGLGNFCNGADGAKTCVAFFSVELGKNHAEVADANVACKVGTSVSKQCRTIHNTINGTQKKNSQNVVECAIGETCTYEYHDGSANPVVVQNDSRVSNVCVCGFNSKSQGYCSFTHDNDAYTKATDRSGLYGKVEGHNNRRYQASDAIKGLCQTQYSAPTWVRHHQEDCSLNKNTVCTDLSTKFLSIALGLFSLFFLF